ncbi:MAG: hypothetical protein FWG68_02750 [Defluviitaleaceae bacterium]|nr:hypothetical protein [Defluviitaleaceae bacterium]
MKTQKKAKIKAKKFVPLAKQSKRQQKEHNKAARNLWDFNPVTRTKPNKKVYDRNKSKLYPYRGLLWIFFVILFVHMIDFIDTL